MRRKKIKLSTRQLNKIPPETLAKMEELGLTVKQTQRQFQDQYADQKERHRPFVPLTHLTSCLSCPICGRLFLVKGKADGWNSIRPVSEETFQKSKSQVVMHLIQDHRWNGERINEWTRWLTRSSPDNEGEKRVQEDNCNKDDEEWITETYTSDV